MQKLSSLFRCCDRNAVRRKLSVQHCWLIPSIKQQGRSYTRRLHVLRIRICESYSQHSVCLLINRTRCQNQTTPIVLQMYRIISSLVLGLCFYIPIFPIESKKFKFNHPISFPLKQRFFLFLACSSILYPQFF